MNILYVCRGNTCRSAMAEAIALNFIQTHDMDRRITVGSAGTQAYGGQPLPMTPEAQKALRTLGIPVPNHKSRKLTQSLIDWADVISTMTSAREQQIRDLFRPLRKRTEYLHPTLSIPDPIGGDDKEYLETAKIIVEAIELRLGHYVVRASI